MKNISKLSLLAILLLGFISCSKENLGFRQELILRLGESKLIIDDNHGINITVEYSEYIIPKNCPSLVHCVAPHELTNTHMIKVNMIYGSQHEVLEFDPNNIGQNSSLIRIFGLPYSVDLLKVLDNEKIRILILR